MQRRRRPADPSSGGEVLRQRPHRHRAIASIVSCVVSDAPSCATSSAICSALRVAVPSSSIAAVKFARPGLSSGIRVAAGPARPDSPTTIGSPRRSLTITVRPLAAVNDRGRRQLQRLAPARLRRLASRHGSSALTASARRRAGRPSAPAASAIPARRDSARRARRARPRARSVRAASRANAFTDAGVTARYRCRCLCAGSPDRRDSGCSVFSRSATPPKPPSVLEPADDPRLDHVARALHLGRRRARRCGMRSSSSSIAFSISSACGRAAPSPRSGTPIRASASPAARVDVLRDLLLVDQLLVQPARLAAAEDRWRRCPHRHRPA